MRRFAAVAAAFLVAVLAGCAFGRRFSAVRPGVDQVLHVWDFTCDDPDVTVVIDHVRPERAGANGVAKVMIRIHRGYDGPSTVVFALKRPGGKTPERSFTVTLFRRTGDAAFWR